jgi:hypothetical protein
MLRRIKLSAIVCVGITGILVAADPAGPKTSNPTPSKPDRSYGTALQWEPTLDGAAKKAGRSGKLLLVLAVAGHFEDPFFT